MKLTDWRDFHYEMQRRFQANRDARNNLGLIDGTARDFSTDEALMELLDRDADREARLAKLEEILKG